MSYHVSPVAPVLPRLGRPSVGALPPAPAFRSGSLGVTTPRAPEPPKLRELTTADRVRITTRQYGADAGSFLGTCLTDPLGPSDSLKKMDGCYLAAMKQVAILKGDQLSFYRSCMSQRGSDVPVILQHNACFAEAQKISPGTTASGPATTYPPPASAPSPGGTQAPSGGMSKWVWIGGAAAVAALAFVVLKPAKG